MIFKFEDNCDRNPSYSISPKGQMLVASPHNPQFPLTHEFPFCCRIYLYLPVTGGFERLEVAYNMTKLTKLNSGM